MSGKDTRTDDEIKAAMRRALDIMENFIDEKTGKLHMGRLCDAAAETERLRAYKVRYLNLREAARQFLTEIIGDDIQHSAACTNWTALEHSQHTCGVCRLRDAMADD